jgi:hypothetical protein
MEASRTRKASFGCRRLFGGGAPLDCLQQTVCPFPPHRYVPERKHKTDDLRGFRVCGHRFNFMQTSLVAHGRHPMGS